MNGTRKQVAEEDRALQSGRQGLAQAEGQLSQLSERLREQGNEDVAERNSRAPV